MIVGTAGHIDHGKTSLVRALTGVDADRLPEEKARGITIDLGYAYEPLPSGDTLGFVDVPGHERFIHNMLAGATGIDHVLLAIAADDGPMPQTLEHLAIVEQLGLADGVVALTKVDRVDDARREAALQEVRRLLAATRCAGFEVQPVSAVSGEGIDDLRRHLHEAAARQPSRRAAGGHFRLAIDRSFTRPGIGTIVTGTVFAGRVAVGDRLTLSPLGIEVRVRGLHAQNRAADGGGIGQRCALNITAPQLDRRDIARGQWLLGSALHAPTDRLDVRLELLGSEDRALRHWTPVHVHLGANDVTGRIALLQEEPLRPGASALAQLVLDAPIGALHGDRFIVRDQSAQRTLGGGSVLDAFGPARGRRKPQRLAVLRALESPAPNDALRQLLDVEPAGVDLDAFARLYNLRDDERARVLDSVAMQVLRPAGTASRAPALGFGAAHWSACAQGLQGWLQVCHQRDPDSPGPHIDELRAALPGRPALPIAAAIAEQLVQAGLVRRAGSRYRLPGHEVTLSESECALWQGARPLLEAAGIATPQVAGLAEQMRTKDELLRLLLRKLVRMGQLHQVRREVFMLPRTVAELAAQAQRLASAHPKGILTVGPFREATGLHRNLGIPVLEYFDRAGFTMRRRDGRRLRREAASVFGEAGAAPN
ncbi:selenocysteine-specific translation elongation factor [Methylibium sp.]|uniref:selenocysteine-specific translation elongation factor n=1 Tax=Methylibium sp. TaxID=2067992 RepID=UPI00184350DD|nr:selenocysteine-specific translation elongation factor [Methylibium sp.]MBA3590094.1 selenocysteine-specific translation elongation factor [Methylibium sp.]